MIRTRLRALAPRPATVHVGGSHGYLEVHRATGYVIRAEHFAERTDDEPGYHDIALFDAGLFAADPACDAFDILETAYWTKCGGYAQPIARVFYPSDDPRDGGGFWEFADEVPYLPPPERRLYAVQPERADNPGAHVEEEAADVFAVYDTTPGGAPSPCLVAAYPVQPPEPGASEVAARLALGDARDGAGAVARLLALGGPMPTGRLPSRTRLDPDKVQTFALEWEHAAASSPTIDGAAIAIGEAAAVSFGDVAGMVYSGLDSDEEWRALTFGERLGLVRSQLDGELTQLRFEAVNAAEAYLTGLGFRAGFNGWTLPDSSGWHVLVTSEDGGNEPTEWRFIVGLYGPDAACAEEATFYLSSDDGASLVPALDCVLTEFRRRIGAIAGEA